MPVMPYQSQLPERGIWMSDINLFTWTRAQQAALALAVLTGSFLGLVTAPLLIGG